jgi:hypothetical protein
VTSAEPTGRAADQDLAGDRLARGSPDVRLAARAGQPVPDPGDPRRIVDVEVLDADTVSAVIAKVDASVHADLLAYRESEVDGLWSLADMAVKEGRRNAEQWLSLLWTAHDHIGDGEREQALVALRALRDMLTDQP